MALLGAWRSAGWRMVYVLSKRVRGGTGIRVRFRIVFRKDWEFESPRTHMSFKAIFFDMDGLLVNTEPISFESTNEVLKTVGVEMTMTWYIEESLAKGTSSLDHARKIGLSDEAIEELRKKRGERYAQLLREKVTPIDGVVDVLSALYGSYVLAVVTSSHRANFDIIMKKTGLDRFFDIAVTADDVTNLKPHPDPYLKAVALSQMEKADCVALEDTRRGVIAAKAAGISCFAIPDELTKGHDFSIADKVLGSIRELPDLLF